MQKIFFTLLALGLRSYAVHGQCQVRLDVSAFRPTVHQKFMTDHKVDGLEIGLSSDTLSNHHGGSLQFGLNMYYTGLGKVKLSGIPLDTPQTGFADVKMRNELAGFNVFVRLSQTMSGSHRMIPYLEIGTGMRLSESVLTITPEQHTEGYEYQTKLKQGSVAGINFMLGMGCLFMIGDRVGITTGAMWTHSKVPGEMVDLSTVERSGSYLEFCANKAPYNILNIKAGLTFLLGESDRNVNYNYTYTSPLPTYYSDPNTSPTTTNSPTTTETPTTTTTSDNSYNSSSVNGNTSSSSSDSGGGCSLFSILFSGCLGGGGSDSNSSSSSGSSGNSSGNDKPNQVKIKKCCGDE
jgi:hypothetical protein